MAMRNAARWVLILLAAWLPGARADETSPVLPLPLPKAVRVQSAGPRAKVWEQLSPKEKQLAFYLTQAGNAGRDLLFYQTHPHSLAIKHLLEESLSAAHLGETKKLLGDGPFGEYLIYAAKFLDQCGPYAGSNRKYLLREVTAAQAGQLLTRYAPDVPAQSRDEIVRLLTDPTLRGPLLPGKPRRQGPGADRRQLLPEGHHRRRGPPGPGEGPEAHPQLPGGADPSGRDVRCADHQ
jgi:hypothetical protein